MPTLIGYGTEGALKFGSYEMLKPLFAQLTRSAFFNCILASCVAGAIAAVVLCPAEEVRIRMVADPDYAPNAAAALGRISREKGPFGSLGGFPAMAAKQVPYTMGKQVSFDFLCTLAVYLLRRSGVPATLAARLAPMVAALPAAVLAAVLSHPGDVLLTEFYKGGSDGEQSSSLLESLRSVVRKRGVGGLFVGLQAILTTAALTTAAPTTAAIIMVMLPVLSIPISMYLSIRRGSCMSSVSSGCSSSCMTRSSRGSASPPRATETQEVPLPPELATGHWLLRGDAGDVTTSAPAVIPRSVAPVR